ncbi:MAG: DUF4386 domain-containing protein [Saccharospirillaceae bacterium]|nr:DUF4386 domain-containing protein [Pseudomonadales bacterium]NRB80768.1 DUF4386 domain-containing protein [Saccharospirillaceae bacterium]
MQTYQNKHLARLAGFLYLLMIPLGVFGIMYMPSNVLVAQDASLTFSNLIEHETMLRISVLSAFLIQIIQIFLVIILYQLWKQHSQALASFMVLFTIAAVPIAMFNELSIISALFLAHSPDIQQSLTSVQLESAIYFLLNIHEQGIMIVHIFWGLWLIPMGLLTYKSGYLPKIIGFLLVIGGFGYCLDTLTFFITASSDYMIAQYTFIGEVLLPITLLWYSFTKSKNTNIKNETQHETN